MPKFLTLNSKIILMLLASILMVLVLVAGVFSMLISDLHQTSAEDDLQRGVELLQIDLLSKSERLLDSRRSIEQDEAILASVNLIARYQQIKDYQPLLFDPEKELLVQILVRELQASDLSFIAIYTSDGEPISFYDRRDNFSGYISYKDSKPVAMLYQPQKETKVLNEVPIFLYGVDMHILEGTQGVHLKIHTARKDLIMESSSPLMKSGKDGKQEIIGWLRIAYHLDYNFVENMANRSALSFAIHRAPVVNKDGQAVHNEGTFFISSKDFDPIGYHFDEQVHELDFEHPGKLNPHFVHSGSYYTAGVTLLTEYSGRLTAVFGLSKSQLSSN
ncbi:MAG TPA: hypothetical protein ENH92_03765, partial [Ectothiorhodospiraceae bacterium]|nr:hypothetical protein [Ectothiorhodospiraceae bacterium]